MQISKRLITFLLIVNFISSINCFALEEGLVPPKRTIELYDILGTMIDSDGNAADDYALSIESLKNRSGENPAIFSEYEFNLIKKGNQKSICRFCPEHIDFLKNWPKEFKEYFKEITDHDKFVNRIIEYNKTDFDEKKREVNFIDTFEAELIFGFHLERDNSISNDINMLGVLLQLGASEILSNFYNTKGDTAKTELYDNYLRETKRIGDFLIDKKKRLAEDEEYALRILFKDPLKAWRIEAAYRYGIELARHLKDKDVARAKQATEILDIALKKEKDPDVIKTFEDMKQTYSLPLKAAGILWE